MIQENKRFQLTKLSPSNDLSHRMFSGSQMQVLIQEKEPIRVDKYIQNLINSFPSGQINADFIEKVNDSKRDIGEYVFPFEIKLITDDQGNYVDQHWVITKRYKDILNGLKKCEKLLRSYEIQNLQKWDPPGDNQEPQMAAKSMKTRISYLLLELKNANLTFQPLHEFLEISKYNATHKILRYKEGYLTKRHGGHFTENRIIRIINKICPCRNAKRWFIISSEGILYCNTSFDEQERCLSLFDQFFSLEYGRRQTGSYRTIVLLTQTRILRLNCETLFETCDWLMSINLAMKNCEFMKSLADKRFLSFAPIRVKCEAKFYVDGQDYYKDVYHAFDQATKEIYITDWFFSPGFYFLRPVNHDLNQETRLDRVLKKAADRGVKIYIILYKEYNFALPNNSAKVQIYMESLSPNIKVQRHPNVWINYWTHHEKIVVVDQKIAFTGGLDLCFGRYDNKEHRLCEGDLMLEDGEFWPGQDYSNVRIKDFVKDTDPSQCLINKLVHPRLPWHDVALQVTGDIVKDASRHFIQYWNFANIDAKRAVIRPEGMTKKKTVIYDDGENQGGMRQKIAKNIKSPFSDFMEQYGKKKPLNIRPEESDIRYKNFDKNFLRSMTYTDYRSNSKNKELIPDEMAKIYVNQTLAKNNIKQGSESIPSKGDLNNEEIIEVDNNDSIEQKIQASKSNPEEEEKKFEISYDNNNNNNYQSSWSMKNVNIERPKQRKSTNPQHKLGKMPTIDLPYMQSNRAQSSRMISPKLNNSKENFEKLISKIVRAAQQQDIEENKVPETKPININQSTRSQKGGYGSFVDVSVTDIEQENPIQIPNIGRIKNNIIETWQNRHERDEDELHLNIKKVNTSGTCQCQLLRSASSWSLGLKEGQTESSIHVAYVQLITQSKHFIYIENQFFMSQNAGSPLTNGVSEALILRIKEAAKNKQNFKVIVILPLIPAFEGEIESGTVLQRQLHYQYRTISRCPESIYAVLRNDPLIPNPEKYIAFYGLRTHAKINEVPTTEQVYVHSKMMIVDDKVAIIGSANINDRSLLGKRDSELCIVVEDKERIMGKMNGKDYRARKFAHELRLELFQEHFGMSKLELLDPLDDNLLDEINRRAKNNTGIYRDIFRCIPDDNVKKFDQLAGFQQEYNLDAYNEKIKMIQGRVVEYPLNFLLEENLNTFSKENFILSETVFT